MNSIIHTVHSKIFSKKGFNNYFTGELNFAVGQNSEGLTGLIPLMNSCLSTLILNCAKA